MQLNNLQLLCPNCHSYTDNYCVNKTSSQISKISDEDFAQALQKSSSIRQALLSLQISDTGANYKKAREIMEKYNITDLKKPQQENNYCIECGTLISRYAQKCIACEAKSRRACRTERNELKKLIRTTSFTKIGEQFGVSDNTIRKWCDNFNLPRRVSEIKKLSDAEWEKI